MSDLETSKNPDNSTRQPLTGWKLWWRLSLRAEDGVAMLGSYKDSAFPACPACASPNVMLTASRKGQSYQCLERDCKSRGSCEVEGSNGVERRKAKVRQYVFLVALVVGTLVFWIWTSS